MELESFEGILERVPKMSRPMRVILAGSDGENMIKGLFAAQEKGIAQPVLVGDRARTMTVLERFGRLDILVCNAGVARDELMLRLREEDFDTVINTNLKGTFLCMKAACRPMVKQRCGRIVAVSSVVGLRGNPGQTNYAASKAGLIGLGKSLAKELASRDVTVNLVAPGLIDTDMTAALPEAARAALLASIPMGRMGAAEDVARAVAFLASDEAAYITGQVLCVDGGMAV